MPSNRKEKLVGLDVVIKIAERCNLACPYCYYYYQDFDNSKYARYISLDVVKRLAAFLAQGAQELGIDRVNLAFHGGEPLLVKKKHFEEMCQIFVDALHGVTKVKLSLQTNGTLVDAQWIDLFEKYKVSVGVSLDGPKEHHDRVRPDKRGRGSYDAALRGIRILDEACRNGRLRSIGALCVADTRLAAREVFEHFDKVVGVPGFSLLLPRAGWGNGLEEDQDRWIEYLDGALDYWLERVSKGDASYNRLLSDAMLPMLNDEFAEMTDWRYSMRHHIVTVSSEGHLAADDNLFSVDARFADTGFNVFNSTLRDFMESPLWKSLIDAVDTVPAECEQCEWYRVCRSGELFNRVDKQGVPTNRSVFCKSLDFIFFRVSQALVRGGLSLEALSERLSSPQKFHGADFSVAALLNRKLLRETSIPSKPSAA